jgi:hypothetical protein
MGQTSPADPPTVDEIVAFMRQAGANGGHRVSAVIVVLWRAGLRIQEALWLTETDLDQRRGSILVRHAKNDRRARSGWTPGHGRRSSHGWLTGCTFPSGRCSA